VPVTRLPCARCREDGLLRGWSPAAQCPERSSPTSRSSTAVTQSNGPARRRNPRNLVAGRASKPTDREHKQFLDATVRGSTSPRWRCPSRDPAPPSGSRSPAWLRSRRACASTGRSPSSPTA